MKFVFISLILILSFDFLKSIHSVRKVQKSHSKDEKSDLQTYITSFNVGNLPANSWILTAEKNELNSKHTITDFVNNLASQKTKIKPIDWVKVKKHFSTIPETMKLFLHLRMKDLLMMISSILSTTTSGFTLATGSNANAFTGTVGRFCSASVTVAAGGEQLTGTYCFRSGGSQTLTSDIDLTVDFEGTYNIYQRLNAMAKFISEYNVAFETLHSGSSLKNYDVNLYSSDFGNKVLLQEVSKLKTNDGNVRWKNFVAANRYSQMHIIYYDALEVFDRKAAGVANTIKPVVRNDIATLLQKTKPSANTPGLANEECGEYLFKFEFINSNGGTFHGDLVQTMSRSTIGDGNRNKAMIYHVQQAAEAGKQIAGLEKANKAVDAKKKLLESVCHILAANFMALEAYVSLGSIVHMLTIQGTLNAQDFALGENENIDSLLMNFGYGVQHYYESIESDVTGGIKKISKYMARTYFAASKLANADHKNCWLDALKPFGPDGNRLAATPPKSIQETIEDFKVKFKALYDLDDEKVRFLKSKAIFLAGYECVKYGFTIN